MQKTTDQARLAVQQALDQFQQLSRATDTTPTDVARHALKLILESTEAAAGVVWLGADPKGRDYRAVAAQGDPARKILDEKNQPIGDVATALRKSWTDPAQAVIVPPGELGFQACGLGNTVQFYLGISAGKKRLGVLQIIYPDELDPKVYRDYVGFCQTAAETIGKHLGHRQSELVERSATHYKALLELLKNLGRIEKPDAFAHELAQGARQLFKAQRAAVVGFWPRKPKAWFSDAIDPNPKATLAHAVRTIADAARETKQPMAFQKGHAIEGQDNELQPFVDQLFELGGAQAVCVTPIVDEDRIDAVLIVEHETAVDASKLAPAEVELAQCAAPFLARAIELDARPLRRVGVALAHAKTHPKRSTWQALAISGTLLLLLLILLMPFPMAVRLDAKLEPTRQHSLTTPFVGTIREVLVNTGDTVQAGQTILRLDDTELQQELTLVLKSIEEQQLARREARMNAQPAELRMAELEIEKLQIQQAALLRRIDKAQIKSPIDGVLLTTRPHELVGNTVDEAQVLLQIGDLSGFNLVVDIPEQEVGLVQTRLLEGHEIPATFLSRPWPDLEQTAAFNSLLELSPTSEPDPMTRVSRYQLRTTIQLEGLEPHLALANPTGRARLDLGYAPLGWRLFRKAWHFSRMTLF
ncbi:efflux RND transporter periplasmic adaptor subunit [Mucisphaera sp.]|uniref:efflux RND transporter periplasmic adaptor subunit n=1 Tax=Mucisphaera sp. TaxID=2913024 RepID=UPI003D132BB5